MKFTIPKTIFGRNIDGALEKLLSEKKAPKSPAQAGSGVKVSASVTPSDYLQIPNRNTIISKYEVAGLNNLNYENTHKGLLNKGLFMPSPDIFMTHFQNVVNAHKGNAALYDGNGRKVDEAEVEDLYKHLTTEHIAAYSGEQEGAWTWLNAKFIKGAGHQNLALEKVTGIDNQGNLITKTAPLETCVWDGSYVKLKFNSQGLPIEESQAGDYTQGKNIHFWYPRENYVARFVAGSGGADLGCGGRPEYSSSSLGVFACAEGAPKKSK